jgi:hypothetical protein
MLNVSLEFRVSLSLVRCDLGVPNPPPSFYLQRFEPNEERSSADDADTVVANVQSQARANGCIYWSPQVWLLPDAFSNCSIT